MSTIPARNSKTLIWLLAALMLAALPAHAQTSPAPTPAKPGSRYTWPRTFSGQPDFEFTRTEVVEDFYKQSKNGKATPLPTLQDLLEDASLDPLGLTTAPEAVSGTTATSGTSVVRLGPTENAAAASAEASLPALNVPAKLDLTEFKSALGQRLTEYLQNWNPNLRAYELSYLLRSLQLGGVMTSPQRRAIINGTSYGIGDQLKATVSITPSDGEILNALDEMMPAPGTMSPLQQKMYQEAFTEKVGEMAREREKNPALWQRTFTLPVTVRDIQSRKVTLEFNGTTYDLAIPFAM